MSKDFRPHRQDWEDLGAATLALFYLGGFVVAMEIALSRLVFLSSF